VSAPQQQGCSLVSFLPLVFIGVRALIGWYAMGLWGIVAGAGGGIATFFGPLLIFATATRWVRRRSRDSRSH